MLELEHVMILLEPLVEMAPLTEAISERGWEIWHTALQDLPGDAVGKAITAYLTSEATGPWLPAPAVIRRLALEFIDGRSLSGDEAWGLVLRAAEHWSQHDPEACRQATAALPAAVLDLFRRLCGKFGDFRQKTIAAQQQDRRAFLAAWREQADRVTRDRMRPAGLQAPIAAAGLPAPTLRPGIDGAITRTAARLSADREPERKTIQ